MPTQLQLTNVSILSIDNGTILQAVSGVVDVSDAVRGNVSCKGDYCSDIRRTTTAHRQKTSKTFISVQCATAICECLQDR